MLETKEQKQILFTCIALVVILVLVSLCSRGGFRFVDTEDYTKPDQNVLNSQEYLAYVNSIQTNEKASQELFTEVLTAEDIRKEVDANLETSQKITVPEVKRSDIAVINTSGKEAMTKYLLDSVGPMVAFNAKTLDLNKSLFESGSISDAVSSELDPLMKKLKDVQVPEEAVSLHTALISSLISYNNLLEVSKSGDAASGDVWPEVYQDYAAINASAQVYKTQFEKLESKYKLADLGEMHFAMNDDGTSYSVIPTAHAILGFGDITVTVGDIPRIIMDAVKEGLVASFSKFMAVMMEKMITKIEQNYMIANFLYYADALVTGQYTDDYLAKYVNDSIDRQIIKKFIPQFACGQQPQNLQPFFKAKSQDYLGFDPSNVSPQDPDYYSKMSRVGNFLASPQGWQQHYEELAVKAQVESQKAIDRELTSSGLKTPRDTMKSAISSSISNIVSAQRAAFNSIMQLGIDNAESFISQFVATVTESLVNKFVFRGALANNSGSIGVLKEQTTCLAAAQFQLVIPAAGTNYQSPPPAPAAQDLIDQACAQFPRGCTGEIPAGN